MAAQEHAEGCGDGGRVPGLAPLAAAQLAAWEKIAADWECREEGRVLRCAACGTGIMLTADGAGRPYRWTGEQALAMTVLHLRARHPDLDPDKGL